MLYMLLYAVGICVFSAGILLVGLRAAVFGPYEGFLYLWIGAMAGADAVFFLSLRPSPGNLRSLSLVTVKN